MKDINVMGIDPGGTTGLAYAQIDIEPSPAICKIMVTQAAYNLEDVMKFVQLLGKTCDKIIVERSPSVMGNAQQTAFFSQLMHNLDTTSAEKLSVRVISPGEWKYLSEKRSWQYPRIVQHIKDAIGLIRYYVWVEYHKDFKMKEEL